MVAWVQRNQVEAHDPTGEGLSATCMAQPDRYRGACACHQEARAGEPHGIGKACVEGF
jgi:hypothetical protein